MVIAKTQYRLGADDLLLVLALARTGTLAAAGLRLGVDASTVFRTLQRLEKGLGQRLFERSRSGYQVGDLAGQLLPHAERIEAELEAARAATQLELGVLTGSVRITSTDTLLHALLLPALRALTQQHPALHYELSAGNELANLSRRDADIALRATARAPAHLVGRHLGPIRAAVFAPAGSALAMADLGHADWIAPDDALPDHPSVRWRRRHLPTLAARIKVNSIQAVLEGIACGLGVGILPLFLAHARRDVLQVSPVLDECETQLWLLYHPESRHLRRIATVVQHLAAAVSLA